MLSISYSSPNTVVPDAIIAGNIAAFAPFGTAVIVPPEADAIAHSVDEIVVDND